MIRTLKVMALGATLVAAGCGSSDSGSDSATPTPSGSLQGGYFASCHFESGAGNDVREVLIFSGSNVEFRAWDHPSTDGSCTGLPTLAEIDTGTFVLGAAVTVPNPSGAGEVAANQLDVTMTSGAIYTIGWVSPSNALYVGDDSGTNNGDTPALRPTTLQSRARARNTAPASFTTLLQNTFANCTYESGLGYDVREVFTFSGGALDIRTYDHPTTNGSCGGDGYLTAAGGQGTYSLGAALAADFGAVSVSAVPVDFVSTMGDPNLYQLGWIDAYATVPTLYTGDDSGANDGSTSLLRPTALQDWKPRYQLAAPPAFPAVLDGTWDSCVFDGGLGFDVGERFVISGSGTTVAFSESNYTSTDGTCSTGESAAGSGSGAATIGASTSATLLGFTVTANKLNVFGMYSIIYVDTKASPFTLYVGDEGATAGLDGTSDAKRPTVLQEWKPRFKQ